MKLYELLEVVNDDVQLRGYDKKDNVLVEGTRNAKPIKAYEEWIINSIWTEQDKHSSWVSFSIVID